MTEGVCPERENSEGLSWLGELSGEEEEAWSDGSGGIGERQAGDTRGCVDARRSGGVGIVLMDSEKVERS